MNDDRRHRPFVRPQSLRGQINLQHYDLDSLHTYIVRLFREHTGQLIGSWEEGSQA